MCCTWLAEIQDAKMMQKIAIWAPSHNFVGLCLRNWGIYRQSEKYLLSSNISSTCPHNMVNFGLLAAEIDRKFGATQLLSTASASWPRYCTAVSSEHQPNFAAVNRERHLCSVGPPSRWALVHILVSLCLISVNLKLAEICTFWMRCSCFATEWNKNDWETWKTLCPGIHFSTSASTILYYFVEMTSYYGRPV